MFSHIPDRDHVPLQIYTHGHDQLQLMTRGKVTYKHHFGDDTEAEWAAYYELLQKGAELKFKKIHIIVVSLLVGLCHLSLLLTIFCRTLRPSTEMRSDVAKIMAYGRDCALGFAFGTVFHITTLAYSSL